MTLWELARILLFGFPMPPEMVDPVFPVFLQRIGGLLLTMIITSSSLIFGAGIGSVLAICRREIAVDRRDSWGERLVSRGIRTTASVCVETVRGLPIMLLVLLMFHLPFRLLGVRAPGVFLAIAAFSLYAGAYISELMRSGFRAVPPGLREAGLVLGLKPRQIFLRIELPLVLRHMLPDVINLAVTVFKDTSTLAVVAVAELTYSGRQLLMSQPQHYGIVLLLAIFFYWAPASLVSALLTLRCDGGSDLRRNVFLGRHARSAETLMSR